MNTRNVTPLDNDARFDLSMAAAARERANRPRLLVIVAGVVLVGALIVFAIGANSRAAAARDLRAEYARSQQIQTLITRLTNLRERSTSGAVGANDPMPVFATLQRVYTQAGMPRTLSAPVGEPITQHPDRERNLLIKGYDFRNITSPELAPIMRWLELAHQEIPGLEVTKIDLRAGPGGWTLTVSFSRVERAQT